MNKKVKYEIKLIDKEVALDMIKKYHYSNTLPKLNKYFVGFFLQGKLVGVVTLGWGTRPKHTIQKLFPDLDTKDYFEIGRMCMTDEMPRNSESQMLSQLMNWIKLNIPEIKVIFTWADGMLGKCGYVYQASNFMYAGKIVTDIYLKDGTKIHPRQTRVLFGLENDKRKTVRPTKEQMKRFDIQHFRGNQYKYVYFVCNKKLRKQLIKNCSYKLNYEYPKDNDLEWQKKDLDTGKWLDSCIPNYKGDSQFKAKFDLEFKKD